MKIVAFNGSPRPSGNTQQLIEEVFKPLKEQGIETQLVQVGGNLLRGCASCYACFKTRDGVCALKGDRMNEFIAQAQQADAIILASPTYYGSVSAEMKAFMDRLGLTTIGQGRTLTRKVGAAVVSVRRGGAVPVYDELNRFMLGSGMIVPGSTYWNFGIGEHPGEIYQDAEGLRNMRDLGEQLAWLMKLVDQSK
ncbi:MAG: flavodoxin family protein [Rikenellaceae bacterium]